MYTLASECDRFNSMWMLPIIQKPLIGLWFILAESRQNFVTKSANHRGWQKPDILRHKLIAIRNNGMSIDLLLQTWICGFTSANIFNWVLLCTCGREVVSGVPHVIFPLKTGRVPITRSNRVLWQGGFVHLAGGFHCEPWWRVSMHCPCVRVSAQERVRLGNCVCVVVCPIYNVCATNLQSNKCPFN